MGYGRSVGRTAGSPATMYEIAAPAREKTGDGVAMCYRLELRDMEMLQFHPTGLLAGEPVLTGAVLEEGLRGVGARMYNADATIFGGRAGDRRAITAGERRLRDPEPAQASGSAAMAPLQRGGSNCTDDASTRQAEVEMHKFLVHKKGDHVGVATSDIEAGEEVVGVYMDDDSTVEVSSRGEIPLGHKIAVEECEPGGAVIEYGVQIGEAPGGFSVGDYVHTHNLKSARW